MNAKYLPDNYLVTEEVQYRIMVDSRKGRLAIWQLPNDCLMAAWQIDLNAWQFPEIPEFS